MNHHRTHHHTRTTHQSGFSLVELMVTVSILAILAAIAVPVYLNQREKAVMATAKNDGQQLVEEIATQLMGKTGAILRDTGTGPTHDGNILLAGGDSSSTYAAGVRTTKGTTITSAGGVTSSLSRGKWCIAVTNGTQTAFFDQDGYQTGKTACDETVSSPTYGQLIAG